MVIEQTNVWKSKDHTLNCIKRWLAIKDQESKVDEMKRGTGYINMIIDMEHSALLPRLISGKEPYIYPPPKAYSRPWYKLLDNNGAVICTKIFEDSWNGKQRIVMQNWGWDLVQKNSDKEYIVRYSEEEGTLWLLKNVPEKTEEYFASINAPAVIERMRREDRFKEYHNDMWELTILKAGKNRLENEICKEK